MTATDELEPDIPWPDRFFSQTSDLAIVPVGTNGLIAGWHGAAPALFGWTRLEVVGRPFGILFREQDRNIGMDEAELSLAALKGRSEDDRWHRRKDGSQFWGSGVTQAIKDESGTLLGFCKLVRDRTDLRIQVKSLENRVAAAELREDHRRAGFASVVHELANPLGAIAAAAALMRRAQDEGARSRACDIVDRQLAVLERLMADLSSLSRAQLGRRLLRFKKFEVQPVLQAALSNFERTRHPQQTLNLVVPPQPLFLEADEQRFLQMVMNLLANAFKYAPRGHITVSASLEGSDLAVRVEDDGDGINPDALDRIFDLFTRENSGADAPDGIGVGLAVVQELARAHGGGVEARSPGKGMGSMFTLRLPLLATRPVTDHDAGWEAIRKEGADPQAPREPG